MTFSNELNRIKDSSICLNQKSMVHRKALATKNKMSGLEGIKRGFRTCSVARERPIATSKAGNSFHGCRHSIWVSRGKAWETPALWEAANQVKQFQDEFIKEKTNVESPDHS